MKREETLKRVKQLILALAENGMCPAARIYNQHRGDLPTSDALRVRYGVTLNRLAVEVGLSPRTVGVGVGQNSYQLPRVNWTDTMLPLTADERLSSICDAPPENLPPKLRWSTDGLSVLRTYQNHRGEICHILR